MINDGEEAIVAKVVAKEIWLGLGERK